MNMKLIDTHAHFDFSHYSDDRSEVMARSREVCEAVVTVGVDIETSKNAIKLAQENDFVYAAVGVHPHVASISLVELDELRGLARQSKVVAVGETGLDYKIGPSQSDVVINKMKQKELLKSQVELANESGKAVIIHARDCWEDLIPTLKLLKPKTGVIHSWTGDLGQAEDILSLGLHISFSGMLTYPGNDKQREVAKEVSLKRVLLETDAPFLPPQSRRGRRNEPFYILEVAEKLAEIKGLSIEEVARETTANARRLFGI
jgi:TatD DNase family protein